MVTFESLPVLLVSAANATVATSVITELVDKDVTEEYINAALGSDRVWRLVNKYYSADVRVHPLIDGAELDIKPEHIEGHIIYITEDEIAEGVKFADRRTVASNGVWRDCDVRVLLLDSTSASGIWTAWAASARAELVPRREMAPAAASVPEPFADGYGMERARAALHAHPWPNLQRTDGQHHPIFQDPIALYSESEDELETVPDGYSEASSESDPWLHMESDSDLDEGFAVEHTEAFAAALGALAGEPRGAAVPPGVPRHARLDRAEELVAAFCRALGLDPDNA